MGGAEATRCGLPAVGMAPLAGCRGFGGRYRYAADHQFDPSGNTPPLAWPCEAGRQFGRGLESDCHELSMIAVCRLGWGGRIAIDTM